MNAVPKNSGAPVRLTCGKIIKAPDRPGFFWPYQLPSEAIPPFNVERFDGDPKRFACIVYPLASCTSREAALAAMRLLGVESYEDWTT